VQITGKNLALLIEALEDAQENIRTELGTGVDYSTEQGDEAADELEDKGLQYRRLQYRAQAALERESEA